MVFPLFSFLWFFLMVFSDAFLFYFPFLFFFFNLFV